jgi:hypothetical protein
LLSNCGLINSALRLAPYALLLADKGEDGVRKQEPSTLESRGQQVVGNGSYVAKTRGHVVSAPRVASR